MQRGASVLPTAFISAVQFQVTSVLPHRPRSQGLGPRRAATGEEITDLISRGLGFMLKLHS